MVVHAGAARAAVLRLGSALGGLALLVAGLPASAAAIDCPGGRTYTWDGAAGDTPGAVGDGVSWDDAFNWDLDCTPGLVKRPDGSPKPQDDHVVIPAGASVSLFAGEQGSVASLTNRGTLTVDTGAVINTRLPSTSARLVLRGLLYGTDTFSVTGSLDWVSTTAGAATQSTRRCAVQDCTTAPPAPGRTLILPGRDDERVRPGREPAGPAGHREPRDGRAQRRRLRRGRLRHHLPQPAPAGRGRPALPHPQRRRLVPGLLGLGQTLGGFVNTGIVAKTGGTGRSVLDTAYRRTDPATSATGTVEVRSGTLSITTASAGDVGQAQVKQGVTFGNVGRTGPQTADPQGATVQLSQPGTALVPVTLQELAPVAGVTNRGRPVRIETPGAQATPTAPLRFRLFFDRTLVRTGETAAGVAQNAPVYRMADGATSYVRLPGCTAAGPSATQACVSRSRSASETSALGNGDVVLVVESLQNSRYRVG